jgi:2,4-dichlorophenol 6-monooxygenase
MTKASMADVTIVGAGATGCTLALLLSRYGIPSTLIERRTDVFNHPAAHVINARSQEIWHRVSPDLAQRIAALAAPSDETGVIRWYTDIRETPLGEIDLLSDAARVARVKTHSPYLVSHIGQHLLMPVLWDAVEKDPLVEFRRGLRVRSVTTDRDSATVRAQNAADDRVGFSSRYVVGTDGANSAVREALGVTMRGPVLANMGSVFFKAKIPFADGTRPLLSWIYAPNFVGVVIAHADDDYVLMTPYLSAKQQIATDSRAFWARTLPAVIGKDINVQIHSTGTWTMTSQTASSFATGNVILAGDAAHRFPHTGGFGLNSGVQDAHNLAWKLAAILEGRAPASLMDTYDIERRAVVERFAEQSVSNHFKLDEVTAGMGPGNRDLSRVTTAFDHRVMQMVPAAIARRVADGLMRLATGRMGALTGDTQAARYRRATLRRRIPAQLEHFASAGLEFGYAYSGPLVHSEPTPQPTYGDGVIDYRPTTWPGARVPYAAITHDGVATSTHDVLDLRAYTLFTGDPSGWRDIDRSLRVVGLETAAASDRATLIDLFEVGEQGAVLARPDGHTAWRTSDPAGIAAADLTRVLREFGIGAAVPIGSPR